MITIDDFEPMDNNLLVEPLSEPEKIGSFFVPPNSVGTNQSRGVVHKLGPGELLPSGVRVPIDVEPGDLVFYSKYAGFPMQAQGTEFMLIPANTLAGKIRDALTTGKVVRASTKKLYLHDEQPPEVDEDGQLLNTPEPPLGPSGIVLPTPGTVARVTK